MTQDFVSPPDIQSIRKKAAAALLAKERMQFEIDALMLKSAALNVEIDASNLQKTALHQHIAVLQNSPEYRAGAKVLFVFARIAPPGSWRRRAIYKSLRALRKLRGTDYPPISPLTDTMSDGGTRGYITMQASHCALINDLVSVVLPVYNQADLLADSIDSVLRQTYPHFELIVLNDGSTDGVEQVLQRYISHPKVRIFTQQNQRLPKALSNAFDHARGEFWTWTSADNLMEPDQLARQVAYLKDHPEVGMVYADYTAIDDRGAILQDPTWRTHNRPDIASGVIRLPHTTAALNTVQDNFIGPCFMYRGWIGKILGDYDPQLGVEDYDYWMRINNFFPIHHLGNDVPLYRYRVHDNTLSARADDHRIFEKVQRLMRYEAERSEAYGRPLKCIADIAGRHWADSHHEGLAPVHVEPADEIAHAGTPAVAQSLYLLGAQFVHEHLGWVETIEDSPICVLLEPNDDAYRLLRVLRKPNVIAISQDTHSAARVRVVNPACPVIDGLATLAPRAVRCFAVNRIFLRQTRTASELHRIAPMPFLRHGDPQRVLLQVGFFTQGGLENVVIDLALTLSKFGYEPTILVLNEGGHAVDKARNRGLEVIVWNGEYDDQRYRAFICERGFAIVNAHYSPYGARICAEERIPFIQTIHNAYAWMDPDQRQIHVSEDRFVSAYTAVSAFAAKYADESLGFDVTKLSILPNGIDLSAFDQNERQRRKAQARTQLGLAADDIAYVNPASIIGAKAQWQTIAAFAKVQALLPNARLFLVGANMDPPYCEQARQLAADLGVSKHVEFVGYDPDIMKYYAAADAVVLPSFWEGWSLAFAEALLLDIPIVGTEVGAAGEFAHHPGVHLVQPPYGDIVNLNSQNVHGFIIAQNPEFIVRLAEAMVRAVEDDVIRRDTAQLCSRFELETTYRSYPVLFDAMRTQCSSSNAVELTCSSRLIR